MSDHNVTLVYRPSKTLRMRKLVVNATDDRSVYEKVCQYMAEEDPDGVITDLVATDEDGNTVLTIKKEIRVG